MMGRLTPLAALLGLAAASQARAEPPPPSGEPTIGAYGQLPTPTGVAAPGAYWQPPAPSSGFSGPQGLMAEIGLGGAYRQMYSVPMAALDVVLGLGAGTSVGNWLATAGGLFGSTDQGLGMLQGRAGFVWEAPLDEWHFGIGPQSSVLAIRRATTGHWLWGLGFGGQCFVGYDLYSTPHDALFLRLGADADGYWGGNGGDDETASVLWGASLILGFRRF